ncbi:transcription factor 7-like 1 [Syngnathus acus]|uniref:transcription factor 7-like 1 n=1 Tax=Syngnathus acus TaxID=161584 RepID=UPI001885E3A6|nr:transcription factor 7-like 1 [Syngnathus acus]
MSFGSGRCLILGALYTKFGCGPRSHKSSHAEKLRHIGNIFKLGENDAPLITVNQSVPGRSLPESSNWCPPGMLNGGDMFQMTGPSVYAAPVSSNSKNGGVVYHIAGPPVFTAPPITCTKRKRRRRRVRDADQPYVKKPPNAFMCFLKEQRQHVKAQMNLKDSASVNTVLGHMWKLLTDEGQAKYYKIADAEKKLHSQMYPEWSSSDNYGNKRRRRSVTATSIADPDSPGEAPTPQTSDESEKMRIADKVLHMLGCA